MDSLSKYEKTRIVGSRALQISMGAPFLVKLSEKDLADIKYNPIEIAKREFDKGVLAMTVRRPLPKVVLQEQKSEAHAAG